MEIKIEREINMEGNKLNLTKSLQKMKSGHRPLLCEPHPKDPAHTCGRKAHHLC
jgi:hypothetical protein